MISHIFKKLWLAIPILMVTIFTFGLSSCSSVQLEEKETADSIIILQEPFEPQNRLTVIENDSVQIIIDLDKFKKDLQNLLFIHPWLQKSLSQLNYKNEDELLEVILTDDNIISKIDFKKFDKIGNYSIQEILQSFIADVVQNGNCLIIYNSKKVSKISMRRFDFMRAYKSNYDFWGGRRFYVNKNLIFEIIDFSAGMYGD